MNTMFKPAAAMALATVAVVSCASPVMAQGQECAPRNTVLEVLEERYGETRQSIGMAPNNSVLEVFASSETGTWTVMVTTPDGTTCLIASGEYFENLNEPAGEPA